MIRYASAPRSRVIPGPVFLFPAGFHRYITHRRTAGSPCWIPCWCGYACQTGTIWPRPGTTAAPPTGSSWSASTAVRKTWSYPNGRVRGPPPGSREFGNFQLVYDSIPPVITPIGPLEGADLSHATRIAFTIRDNLGTLRHFRAELDGQWLCFTNDKALAYIYKFDQHCPPGPHTLKVTVRRCCRQPQRRRISF